MAAGAVAFIGTPSSSGSLLKSGDGLVFQTGALRFDGGTTVSAGKLEVWYADLFSNVTIAPGATLSISGDVVGNVLNNGIFEPTDYDNSFGHYEFYDDDIFGDYTQGPEGILRVRFGLERDHQPTPLVNVSGSAHLDGHLEFVSAGYIPSGGYLEWVLHANGGVYGQFDDWRVGAGGPLFLTGALNYSANDVWFLATRVSTQATMTAAAAGDAFTLASAANVDRAFVVGDALVAKPALLSATQRAFLGSAATLQRIDSLDRAVTAFDSLAGQGHAEALDAALGDALDAGPAASVHAASVADGWRRSGSRSGGEASAAGWSARPAFRPGSAGLFVDARAAGLDYQLDSRTLAGSSVGWSEGEFAFDRGGGHARDRSPRWQAWIHRDGDGGRYAFGSIGASHHRLELDRRIDVGNGARLAQSVRDVEAANAYVELGRAFDSGGHRISGFAALDYAALRAGALDELGTTGFELDAPPAWRQQLRADLGLRDSRAWRLGSGRWLQFGAGLTWRQVLLAPDPLRAAFAGAPGASFDVSAWSPARSGPAARLDLAGGGARWAWQLQLDSASGREAATASLVRLFR